MTDVTQYNIVVCCPPYCEFLDIFRNFTLEQFGHDEAAPQLDDSDGECVPVRCFSDPGVYHFILKVRFPTTSCFFQRRNRKLSIIAEHRRQRGAF